MDVELYRWRVVAAEVGLWLYAAGVLVIEVVVWLVLWLVEVAALYAARLVEAATRARARRESVGDGWAVPASEREMRRPGAGIVVDGEVIFMGKGEQK